MILTVLQLVFSQIVWLSLSLYICYSVFCNRKVSFTSSLDSHIRHLTFFLSFLQKLVQNMCFNQHVDLQEDPYKFQILVDIWCGPLWPSTCLIPLQHPISKFPTPLFGISVYLFRNSSEITQEFLRNFFTVGW